MEKTASDQSNQSNQAEQPQQSGKQIAFGILGFIIGFVLFLYIVKLLLF